MPSRRHAHATHSVFIHCPIDPEYERLFRALIFAIQDCGFYARCSLEIDAGESRFQTICDLINRCRYGIHDLSRTQLDPKNQLPRFNMPLELGLFLGAREFSQDRKPRKVCLVLDTEPFRYQKFCSDLAGVDIHAHDNQPEQILRQVCDWLQTQTRQPYGSRRAEPEILPDAGVIFGRYQEFLNELPALCRARRRNPQNLIFPVYTAIVESWLRANPWQPA
jgi:hypothetical protein